MIDEMLLTAKINELASAISAPASMLPKIGVENDFAYPYIAIDRNYFYYVIKERGEILEQRQTSALNELLSWIFQDVTFQMAEGYELKNRVPARDCRQLLWDHQLQLLERLRSEWRAERQQQIDQILQKAPFSDSAGDN